MTKKKEFLRKMDTVQGVHDMVGLSLHDVRLKMSEHAGLTHDDEVKLLGLKVIIERCSTVYDEAKTEIDAFIETHKFKP